MKLTKIILHLLTVLTLISAIGLVAVAVLYRLSGRGGGSSQGDHYANLAIGAVLTAILLQIVVIVLKIMNRQDVKRELRVAAFIAGTVMLVLLMGLRTEPIGLFLTLVLLLVIVVGLTRWWWG